MTLQVPSLLCDSRSNSAAAEAGSAAALGFPDAAHALAALLAGTLGDLVGAEALEREALASARAAAPRAPTTAVVATRLARVLAASGEDAPCAEAADLYAGALADFRASLGDGHGAVASTATALVSVFAAAGDGEAAAAAVKPLLDSSELPEATAVALAACALRAFGASGATNAGAKELRSRVAVAASQPHILVSVSGQLDEYPGGRAACDACGCSCSDEMDWHCAACAFDLCDCCRSVAVAEGRSPARAERASVTDP